MKPCKFKIYARHPERHQEAISFLQNSLISAGFENDDNSSLVIVLGGDGALLKTLSILGIDKKYILINTGHLGFFSDYSIDEISKFIVDITSKEEKEEKLPIMSVTTKDKEYDFFNDLALQSDVTSEFIISLNGKEFTKSRASGIVLGTAISSTGYLASLKSPLVVDEKNIYQYSFVAPISNRLYPNTIEKAILPLTTKVDIRINGKEALLIIDGAKKTNISNCNVQVAFKNKYTTLLHFNDVNDVDRIKRSITGEE